MQDLIINYTPTGMVPTKDMNAAVPISVSEIIEDVHKASEIGITMVHLHARDDSGAPTYKSSIYRDIIEGIRKHTPELIICASCSGRDFAEFEKRSEVLELKPDLGSLTLSSLNFSKTASINAPEMVQLLAEKMLRLGIKPELEVFDLGMLNYGHYLIKKGLITPPYYFNIILGNIAGMQADLSSIGTAINLLPSQSYWSLGGIGKQQLIANSISIALGGGVRVGLEDNLYIDQQSTLLATNHQLLNRVHTLASIHERLIMQPKDLGTLGFYNKINRVV